MIKYACAKRIIAFALFLLFAGMVLSPFFAVADDIGGKQAEPLGLSLPADGKPLATPDIAALSLGASRDTYAQLADWCADSDTVGETYTLTGSITIGQADELFLENRTIDTDRYSLIAEGVLLLGENAVVTGRGNEPVVIAQNGGGISVGFSMNYSDTAQIIATGNNATALYIRDDCNEYLTLENDLRIMATGAGSTAVRSEIPLFMRYALIEAGGVGIECEEEVNLYLCKVNGEMIAPGVTLDTCSVSPAPANVISEITRKVTSIKLLRFDMVHAVGEDYSALLNVDTMVSASLSAPGVTSEAECFTLNIPDSRYDNGSAGRYGIPGTLITPFDWLELDCFEGIYVEIYDPALPYLRNFGEDPASGYYAGYEHTGAPEALTALVCRLDETEWREMPLVDGGNMDYDADNDYFTICLDDGDVTASFWMYFEVGGIGNSPVIFFSLNGDGDIGGDRDYGDYTGGKLPPPPRGGGFSVPVPTDEGYDSNGGIGAQDGKASGGTAGNDIDKDSDQNAGNGIASVLSFSQASAQQITNTRNTQMGAIEPPPIAQVDSHNQNAADISRHDETACTAATQTNILPQPMPGHSRTKNPLKNSRVPQSPLSVTQAAGVVIATAAVVGLGIFLKIRGNGR